MTRRSDIDRRLTALAQISGVMDSMKKLSQMEAGKVERLLLPQRETLNNIRRAFADFQTVRPLADRLPAGATRNVYVIWGSERGFCGDFNQRLLTELVRINRQEDNSGAIYIAIGRRCAIALQRGLTLGHALPGAGTADEIPAVLGNLVEILAGQAPESLMVLSHHAQHGGIVKTRILPPVATEFETSHHRTPLLLNLAPEKLLKDLLDHYLYMLLHGLAYESLLAECRYRMQHLEAAGSRLGEQKARLHRRRNLLRQEEITEELEIILLSTTEA